MPLNQWAILCPGPSLEGIHLEDIFADYGSVIAVNGAILHPAAVSVRYWAMADAEVFRSCCELKDMRALTDRVVLWTHHNFENSGRTAEWTHEIAETFRAFSALFWKNLTPIMGSWDSGICWENYTVFSAIALAIHNGAQKIRLYGADMGGMGYFQDGLTNFRTDHRFIRWQHEKAELKKIIDYYSERAACSFEIICNANIERME